MAKQRLAAALSPLKAQLLALKRCPRELWMLFFLKFCESYAYFSMSISFTIFLSDEFGYDDEAAGWLYGIWGVLISSYGLISGPFVDYFGVKAALIVGGVIAFVGRLLIAFSFEESTVLLCVLFLIPLGTALGIPVMTICVKRYTNNETRTMGYSLFYSFMNVAALAAGPITDVVRAAAGDGILLEDAQRGEEVSDADATVTVSQEDGGNDDDEDGGKRLTAIRIVFLSGALVTIFYIAVAAWGIREIDVDASGDVKAFDPSKFRASTKKGAIMQYLSNHRLWRLMLFVFLLVGVRLNFRHLDATFPKYMIREFGEDAPYGSIYAINPFLIIFLVPIVGSYTTHIPAFQMILQGSYVAGASVFVLCIGAYYWTAISWVVLLSIGEAWYSPRVYEYTMMISPKGNEGVFTALASTPMFLAKLFAGGLSGYLLGKYCPETVEEGESRNSEMMWFIIGLISFSSPIGITLFQRIIHPPGTDDVLSQENDAIEVELSVTSQSSPSPSSAMLSPSVERSDTLATDRGAAQL